MNLNAHLFRVNGTDHVVLNRRTKIKRTPNTANGHHFLCGPKLTDQAQRITAVTRPCDKCLRSFNGFVDLCDAAERKDTP